MKNKKHLTIKLEIGAFDELNRLARGWEKNHAYNYGDDVGDLLADYILSDSIKTKYLYLYDKIEAELE